MDFSGFWIVEGRNLINMYHWFFKCNVMFDIFIPVPQTTWSLYFVYRLKQWQVIWT